jgi:hypothetical protein
MRFLFPHHFCWFPSKAYLKYFKEDMEETVSGVVSWKALQNLDLVGTGMKNENITDLSLRSDSQAEGLFRPRHKRRKSVEKQVQLPNP